MRRNLVCEIGILFLLTIPYFGVSKTLIPVDGGISSKKAVEEGSFFLENTSKQFHLLKEDIYGMGIGATWNLTVQISPKSTSAVNFSLHAWCCHYWEGIREFQVKPSETRIETYVLHVVSDAVPWMNWFYSLTKSDKNASGTFQVQRTHSGYYADFHKTGSVYVSNITAWLEAQSSTSIPSTSSIIVNATNSTSDMKTSQNSTTTNPLSSIPIPGFGGWITIFSTMCLTLVSIFRKRRVVPAREK